MSDQNDWLAMLSKATSYNELQQVFVSMSIEAQSTDKGEALAATIDEAIRRIEQERVRDQSELDSFTAEYDTFKQQQSGVIGWFKRKLPFTETRKQELGHRDVLNDQKAEILADNFVIARAQMLKESILPPHLRRLGHPPSVWRDHLLQHESVAEIRSYGTVLRDLSQELPKSTAFIDTVTSDVEAFASAHFSDKENQLRRNADLLAARAELKALVDELKEKTNVRKSALASLMGLVTNELSTNDPEFRNAIYRLQQLKGLQEKHPQVTKLLEDRQEQFKLFVNKRMEWESLPDKRESTTKAIRTLKREAEDAQQRQSYAVAELEGPSRLYQAALQEAQRTKVALDASKPLYDAYIKEHSGAEVTCNSDFEVTPSNVLTEYRRLEDLATQAANALSQLAPAFEAVKHKHDQTLKEMKNIHQQLEAQNKELENIDNLDNELRNQLKAMLRKIEASLPQLRGALHGYASDASRIDWLEVIQLSGGLLQDVLRDANVLDASAEAFSVEQSHISSRAMTGTAELRIEAEQIRNVIKSLHQAKKVLDQELATLTSQRKVALQRRCQMLLDESVSSELEFD